jgi:hypothetical protein
MGKAADERITPAMRHETCQRENIRGLIVSSITQTGNEYALSTELIDSKSDETVRFYSGRFHGQGHSVDALGLIAVDARRDFGESLNNTANWSKPFNREPRSAVDNGPMNSPS